MAEVDPHACAVIEHHYPDVTNLGDVDAITQSDIAALGKIDIVVAGTPCQDLSVAGKRAGLAGERSGLFNAAMRVVQWAANGGARWFLWENVPGTFSCNAGRDFAAVVGAMAGRNMDVPEGGWRNAGFCLGERLVEWCVLDAQHFGVPQRRRRIFALADFGYWQSRRPILLEQESLHRHPAPGSQARKTAPTIPARSTAGGGLGTDFDCDGGLVTHAPETSPAMKARDGKGPSSDGDGLPLIAHTLRGEGCDASEDGTGRGSPPVPVAFDSKASGSRGMAVSEISPTLRAMNGARPNGGGQVAVAFDMRGREGGAQLEGPHYTANIMAANGGSSRSYIQEELSVRRLTPPECLRLQGFPDDFFDGVEYKRRPLADGPKYRMLGNSMAVPVVAWLGKQIEAQT